MKRYSLHHDKFDKGKTLMFGYSKVTESEDDGKQDALTLLTLSHVGTNQLDGCQHIVIK